MIELVKVLIERVLSWPVAIFILCLIFRKPLKQFLGRIVLLKAPGVEVSAPTNASQQLAEAESHITKDQLAQPIPVQPVLPIPEDLARQRETIRTYGGGLLILGEQMENIRIHLENLQFQLNTPETTNVLIRHLAVTQLLLRTEVTYRLIFGSQIAVLELLNQQGPQSEDVIRPIFETAKAKSPEFYGHYSFENWIQFLIREIAILKEDNLYKITVYGGEFLSWMVGVKAPKKAH